MDCVGGAEAPPDQPSLFYLGLSHVYTVKFFLATGWPPRRTLGRPLGFQLKNAGWQFVRWPTGWLLPEMPPSGVLNNGHSALLPVSGHLAVVLPSATGWQLSRSPLGCFYSNCHRAVVPPSCVSGNGHPAGSWAIATGWLLPELQPSCVSNNGHPALLSVIGHLAVALPSATGWYLPRWPLGCSSSSCHRAVVPRAATQLWLWKWPASWQLGNCDRVAFPRAAT
jgi:hypothetical protein